MLFWSYALRMSFVMSFLCANIFTAQYCVLVFIFRLCRGFIYAYLLFGFCVLIYFVIKPSNICVCLSEGNLKKLTAQMKRIYFVFLVGMVSALCLKCRRVVNQLNVYFYQWNACLNRWNVCLNRWNVCFNRWNACLYNEMFISGPWNLQWREHSI